MRNSTTVFRGACLNSKTLGGKEKLGPQGELLETGHVLFLSRVMMKQVFTCDKLSSSHFCLGHLSMCTLHFTIKMIKIQIIFAKSSVNLKLTPNEFF